MSDLSELKVLFHAWSLESRFFSTKLCILVKEMAEGTFSKEEFLRKVPLPSEPFWQKAKDEISQASDMGIACISILDEEYPSRLTTIEDPPILLFVMGKTGLISRPFHLIRKCYGMVGARKSSIYGEAVTKGLAKGLSNLGITVVSGLALGIDKRAHEGAIAGSAEVPTIAILGSGLLQLHPRTNTLVAEEIIDSGGFIVSEYGLKEPARVHLFPRRNRIISALSSAIVVIEAEERSGSLITARLASEQGRDVFAVPGPIDSSLSKGTNKLISQGAGIIYSVDSFLEEVKDREGIKSKKVILLSRSIDVSGSLSMHEKKVLDVLNNEIMSFEDIYYKSSLEHSELRLAVTSLMLKDLIVERDGVYYKG